MENTFDQDILSLYLPEFNEMSIDWSMIDRYSPLCNCCLEKKMGGNQLVALLSKYLLNLRQYLLIYASIYILNLR